MPLKVPRKGYTSRKNVAHISDNMFILLGGRLLQKVVGYDPASDCLLVVTP